MSGMFELDGFEPIKRVGGGGFGDVWLARQTNVDRQVAVKVGHAPIQDETIKLRFERECKALGRLSGHPNIIDVYTAGSLNDGRPYLVLEYIDGGTLWQRLKREAVTERELISIGGQLAGALDVAHSSGVLHRDLKPENILMRTNGDAVLGDFGIARLQDGASTTSAAITASVAYAAPEVLSGKRATVASDLYGIGVCLLAAVIRSVPYVEKSDSSIHPIINRVLTDRHPDIRALGISGELAVIIDALLEKDPDRRPATAAEAKARFEAAGARRLLASDATQVVGDRIGHPGPQPAPLPPHRPTAPPPGGVPAPPGEPHRVAAQTGPDHRPGWGPDAPPTSDVAMGYAPYATGQEIVTSSGNLRLFVLAYAATLVVGGLLLYLALQLRSDDGSPGLDAGTTSVEPAAVDAGDP